MKCCSSDMKQRHREVCSWSSQGKRKCLITLIGKSAVKTDFSSRPLAICSPGCCPQWCRGACIVGLLLTLLSTGILRLPSQQPYIPLRQTPSLWCCLWLFCSMCAGLVFLCNTTLVDQSSCVLWSLCIVTLPFSASTSFVIPASFTNLVSVNAVLSSWSFRKTLNSMWSRNNFQKTTCDLSQLDFQPFTTTPCTR